MFIKVMLRSKNQVNQVVEILKWVVPPPDSSQKEQGSDSALRVEVKN